MAIISISSNNIFICWIEVIRFEVQFYMLDMCVYRDYLLSGWSIMPSSLFDFSKLWWVRARAKSSFFLQKVARWKMGSVMNMIAICKSLRYATPVCCTLYLSSPCPVAPLSLHVLSIVTSVLLIESFGIAWRTMVIYNACYICLSHSYWISNFILCFAEL